MPKDQAKQQQPSRKGKASWRKNIDLAPVEERLEIQRQAEALGLAVGVGQAGDLFVEDRKGDEALLARQRKNRRGLKSLEVLNRDAVGVPAVLSRKEKGSLGGKTPEERSGMSAKQIAKLRRTTGRQTGPFGAIVEQSQEDKEEQRAKADIKVAEYDVWGAESPRVHVKPLKHDVEKRRLPDVPLPLPDPGQSYNPPAEAHDALLGKAMKVAEEEEKERLKHREWKRKWDAGGEYARQEEEEGKNVMGMKVEGEEDGSEEPDDEQAEVEALTTKKEPKRKTKAQRARSLKHKEAVSLPERKEVVRKLCSLRMSTGATTALAEIDQVDASSHPVLAVAQEVPGEGCRREAGSCSTKARSKTQETRKACGQI